MFDRMAADRRNILRDGMILARSSNGSVQYPDVLLLTPYERSLIRELDEEIAEQMSKI